MSRSSPAPAAWTAPPEAPPEAPAPGLTSSGAGPRRDADELPPRDGPRDLTLTDLVGLGGVALLALVAALAFVAAHVRVFEGWAVLSVAAAVVAGVLVLARRRGRGAARFRFRADPAGLVAVLAVVAGGLLLTAPGFGYGVTDKDPGGYVAHALHIARTGSWDLVDPALATPGLPDPLAAPGARFPGVWVEDVATGVIVPQFYHLWPSLLAVGADVAGVAGLLMVPPLAGAAAVAAFAALARRLAGPAGAWVAGGLLAVQPLFVWHARYPTTEVFAMACYVGAALGAVVSIATGRRWPAATAGALVAVGFLNRADGVLLLLVAVGVVAVLIGAGRFDARVGWFLAGLGALLPLALYQAYGWAGRYTADNGVPGLVPVLVLVAGLPLAGLLVWSLLPGLGRWVVRLVTGRRAQFGLGFALCTVAGVGLLLGFLRPWVFGLDYGDFNGRELRSYDELIFHRLAWFLTLPAFALAGLGLAVVALRRWRAGAWVALAPWLLIFPVYAMTARNSTRLMWWSRRYVPVALPGLLLLVAVVIVFALFWRYRGRRMLALPAMLAAAGLVAAYLVQSVPLRRHDEFGGSFAISRSVSQLSGDERGVYLWQRPTYCCFHPTSLFATAVWLGRDELSVMLPSNRAGLEEYVREYSEEFGDEGPVFVVWNGGLPPELAALDLEPVQSYRGVLPVWEESDIERPDEVLEIPYEFDVYQVAGT
jgi:hypothetical protein